MDAAGNRVERSQQIIVDDATPPEVPTLLPAFGECSVTLIAPTTTDNCAGEIIGTTSDPLVYSVQGSHTVHWTFDDGHGNSFMQDQTVIVDDITDPAKPVLPEIIGIGSVTLTAPTTTDNCKGSVIGTTTDPLTYSIKGLHTVTWTFDDGNGNSVLQTQAVKVYENPILTVQADPVQYSDIAQLKATLKSVNGTPLNGVISWSINGSSVGTSNALNGEAMLQWTANGIGSFEVVAAFAGDPENYYGAAAGSALLGVGAEDAAVAYKGAPIIAYPNKLVLWAQVTQTDNLPGDITKARVEFVVTNGSGNSTSYSGTCNSNGEVLIELGSSVGVYSISYRVIGGYFESSPEMTIVPVYDPKGGFATGGGFINVTDPADGDLGRANFGFNARYEKGSSTGHLEFQYKDGSLDLKSTSIDWLVISSVSAQFQGTATIQGWQGTYIFRVNCTDNQASGSPDKFTISVWAGNDTEADPIYKAQNQNLGGGNILVKNK